MNNKAEEVKEQPKVMDINSAISQKILELQKLVSQLQDHGCLVLYSYDDGKDDSKGYVRGMIDGKGAMVKRALEKLAMNDKEFQDILAYAYIDSMPSMDSGVAQLMHLITHKDDE